jgi:hypothetical protein
MLKELKDIAHNASQYLSVGEMDEDKCIVKYAGYIQYQTEFLMNQLASEGTLHIQEYEAMVKRMNDLLLKLESYLYGEPLPECSEEDDPIQDFGKQEIQDYIYNQNGVFNS